MKRRDFFFASSRAAAGTLPVQGFDRRNNHAIMLDFRYALRDEPERLRQVSIREILASPCQQEFCQLWIDDYRPR
jgi:hypothetical protein